MWHIYSLSSNGYAIVSHRKLTSRAWRSWETKRTDAKAIQDLHDQQHPWRYIGIEIATNMYSSTNMYSQCCVIVNIYFVHNVAILTQGIASERE